MTIVNIEVDTLYNEIDFKLYLLKQNLKVSVQIYLIKL